MQQQSSVQQSVDAQQKPPAQELQLPLHQQQPPHYHAVLAQQPQQRSRLSLDGRSQHRPPQKPLQISSVAEDLQPLGPSAIGVTSNATMPDAAVPSASSLSQPAVASLTPSRQQLAAVHGQNTQHRSSGKGSPEASSSRVEIKSAPPLTPSHSARQLLTPLVIRPSTQPSSPPSPAPGIDGLRFVLGLGTKTMSPNQALTALAEGQVQCAITGAAFQHLLESSDLDALEIVMRSVVVFARMQPHQKGRAVELLTIKGVHQMHNGSSRHVQVAPCYACCCYACCCYACFAYCCLPTMHAAAVPVMHVVNEPAMYGDAAHAAHVVAVHAAYVPAVHVAAVPATQIAALLAVHIAAVPAAQIAALLAVHIVAVPICCTCCTCFADFR